MVSSDLFRDVIDSFPPLPASRDRRLPLFVWTLQNLSVQRGAKDTLLGLDARGIPVITSWNPAPGKREESLDSGISTGKLQMELGLIVTVDATRCMHYFCDGSPETAHIDSRGEPFFDLSHSPDRKIGCPFALDIRYPAIKEQLQFFLSGYRKHGIGIDMIFLDWEIDGPLEWNGSREHAKRCVRCREHVSDLDDFGAYQTALRSLRGEMQREVFTDTVKASFPNTLSGNYAVHPHNGFRYWYDYFERTDPGAVCQKEGKAEYRKWYDEFSHTGYSLAMPVIYPWQEIFSWYDFDSSDYRWFYNMLKTATNACTSTIEYRKTTSAAIPLAGFVHWNPIFIGKIDPAVTAMSRRAYKELLWHMLLRGMDGFILWCPSRDTLSELDPVWKVYAESLEYREVLEDGEPVSFDLPFKPGTVVSGVQAGHRLLIRRTDFAENPGPVELKFRGGEVIVPPGEGICRILEIRDGMT